MEHFLLDGQRLERPSYKENRAQGHQVRERLPDQVRNREAGRSQREQDSQGWGHANSDWHTILRVA